LEGPLQLVRFFAQKSLHSARSFYNQAPFHQNRSIQLEAIPTERFFTKIAPLSSKLFQLSTFSPKSQQSAGSFSNRAFFRRNRSSRNEPLIAALV
jgi:hypothetical protein